MLGGRGGEVVSRGKWYFCQLVFQEKTNHAFKTGNSAMVSLQWAVFFFSFLKCLLFYF